MLRCLYSLCIFVAVAVSDELVSDQSCDRSLDNANATTGRDLAGDHVMLQQQMQVQMRTQVSSRSVALHMKAFKRDALNVASVIKCGMNTVLRVTLHFSTEPPRVAEGIMDLGTDLLKCVEKMLRAEDMDADGYRDFKQAWEISFNELPLNAQSIEADIALYARDGHEPALIRAIGSIIGEAGTIVSRFLPRDVGREVRVYLDSVVETLDTLGTSWNEFAQGNTVEGIEAIYWGLRTITDSFMPDVLKDNDVYNTIIGTLDFVLGNLSKTVLEYERRIMESNVCWRTEKRRGEQRPSKCWDNYVHDGSAYCYPVRHSLISAASSTSSLDGTLAKKDGDGGGYAVGGGAIPASCDPNSDYAEKHGHYCYTPCGSGWQVKPGDYKKCISACEGKFPAETPQMCGRDQGIVTRAILEMVTTVLNSAFTLAENIIKMQEDGVNAELLSSTIQVFIDMGKPFANPTCPEGEEELPAVNPAICSESCMVGDTIGLCRIKSGGFIICLTPQSGDECAAGQTPCPPTPSPTLFLPTPEPTKAWVYEGRRPQSYCMHWCRRNTQRWSNRCGWSECKACDECSAPALPS